MEKTYENEIEIEYPRDYDFPNDLGNAYEEDYSHTEEIDSNENGDEGEEPMSRWFLVRVWGLEPEFAQYLKQEIEQIREQLNELEDQLVQMGF